MSPLVALILPPLSCCKIASITSVASSGRSCSSTSSAMASSNCNTSSLKSSPSPSIELPPLPGIIAAIITTMNIISRASNPPVENRTLIKSLFPAAFKIPFMLSISISPNLKNQDRTITFFPFLLAQPDISSSDYQQTGNLFRPFHDDFHSLIEDVVFHLRKNQRTFLYRYPQFLSY